jgi:hypothetical protein
MSAIAIQRNVSPRENFDLIQNHLEMLIEELRDVDLERRMITIIEADSLLNDLGEKTLEIETCEIKLQEVRRNLEEELGQIQRMLFIVNRLEASL